MSKRVNTIPEDLIKPMLDAHVAGRTLEEVAATIGRPVEVVRMKLLRMGYINNGTTDLRTEARFKALEELCKNLNARLVALETKSTANVAPAKRAANKARR